MQVIRSPLYSIVELATPSLRFLSAIVNPAVLNVRLRHPVSKVGQVQGWVLDRTITASFGRLNGLGSTKTMKKRHFFRFSAEKGLYIDKNSKKGLFFALSGVSQIGPEKGQFWGTPKGG